MFERRHYRAIAEALASINDPVTRATAAGRLAEMFERDNARFKRERFLTAANVSAV